MHSPFFKTLLALFLICGSAAQAQISNYYNPAIDLGDEALKAALHDIIDGHQTFPYSSGGTDTWDILKLADRDPNNPQNVILIYTGRSENAAQEFNNGNGWNREHVWPQSRGGLGTGQGVGTDVFNLRPSDIAVNAQRGNLLFDDCISCTEVVSEGDNTGSFIDNSNGTFEPRDAVKGDIARMLFYMAVRYEGGGELDLELVESVTSGQGSAPLMGRLSTLLAWNLADPVDDFEMNRNEVIFDYQGNRNPFVDHPELAEHLWGNLQVFTWPYTLNTSATAPEATLRLYPNPARGTVRINQPYESARVCDLQGREMMQGSQSEVLDISPLPAGMYLLQVAREGGQSGQLKLLVY